MLGLAFIEMVYIKRGAARNLTHSLILISDIFLNKEAQQRVGMHPIYMDPWLHPDPMCCSLFRHL